MKITKSILAPFHKLPVELEDRKVFFLAGPIMGGGGWQRKATEFLWYKCPECIVADPSYEENENENSCEEICGYLDHKSFLQQAEWESYAMKLASQNGTLFFWLPAESKITPRPKASGVYARDTRVELGIWIERFKNNPHLSVKIGGDKDFDGLPFIHYYANEGSSNNLFTFSNNVIDFIGKTI